VILTDASSLVMALADDGAEDPDCVFEVFPKAR
jgi:hypothetical protein